MEGQFNPGTKTFIITRTEKEHFSKMEYVTDQEYVTSHYNVVLRE